MTLVISFLLIFLPQKPDDISRYKINFLKAIFGIQVYILVCYFLSGYFKFYGLLSQTKHGLISALYPESLGLNIAKTTFVSEETYFLGDMIMNNSSYFFSFLLLAGYLIEFLSIYIIYRTDYHSLWGMLLILLHGMIILTVGPNFTLQMMMIGVFLLFSPFGSDDRFDMTLNPFRGYSQSVGENKIKIFFDSSNILHKRIINLIRLYGFNEQISFFDFHETGLVDVKPDDFAGDVNVFLVKITIDNDTNLVKNDLNGVTWLLRRLSVRFLPLRIVYKLSPFLFNFLYKLYASVRIWKTKPAK